MAKKWAACAGAGTLRAMVLVASAVVLALVVSDVLDVLNRRRAN